MTIANSTTRRRFLLQGTAVAGGLALAGRLPARAADTPTSDALAAKAVAFLKPRQNDKGGWSTERGPGITGIVATALLRSKRVTPADPAIGKALAYLESFITAKGAVGEGGQTNYVTSIAIMAFQEANTRGQYDGQIRAAQAFLKGLQWDEGEKKGPDDPYYGGAGYGGSSRPDLSNTAFFIEALRDTGLPADDPALKKALAFVSRCQNRKSEFNDQPWADKVNDGGFIYTAANGGDQHGDRPQALQRRLAFLCEHDLCRTQEHDPRWPLAQRPALSRR